MARRGEFQLIAEAFAPLAKGDPLAFGLGDDVALVAPRPGEHLVATNDAMVRGVHFFRDGDPGDVGRKLLRVNLSDLACKGAEPLAYLLTVALPPDLTDGWLDAFAAGLGDDQKRYGIHLIGGDTTKSELDLVLSVTMLGSAPAETLLRRNGAKVGDRIYVSGTIGDARLGFLLARGKLPEASTEDAQFLRGRLDRPSPRLKLGRRLRGIANSAMDVSDGLLADLGHICEQSQVGAELSLAAVPFSDAARRVIHVHEEEQKSIITFGDDYEILFTAPPDKGSVIAAIGDELGVPLTVIGTIVSGGPVTVRDASGAVVPFAQAGYTHF